ncbi:hypothetical protein Acr_00g0015860 [Actinidia rufa]|uniref:Uncharacterized protein n=1 Tax=Actinidia rufa TaxID=165716 RepID=A0A7J0DAP8_9ERIC|nr:hypothetical protein Acr_00g0015860 [Actinidia rufa]
MLWMKEVVVDYLVQISTQFVTFIVVRRLQSSAMNVHGEVTLGTVVAETLHFSATALASKPNATIEKDQGMRRVEWVLHLLGQMGTRFVEQGSALEARVERTSFDLNRQLTARAFVTKILCSCHTKLGDGGEVDLVGDQDFCNW